MTKASVAAPTVTHDGIERKVSPHEPRRIFGADVERTRTYLDAMRELQSRDYIFHVAGRSWRKIGCKTCFGTQMVYLIRLEHEGRAPWVLCPGCNGQAGNMLSDATDYETKVRESEVLGLPADHRDGSCFECSGVEPPPGWHERMDRIDDAVGLRGGKMRA